MCELRFGSNSGKYEILKEWIIVEIGQEVNCSCVADIQQRAWEMHGICFIAQLNSIEISTKPLVISLIERFKDRRHCTGNCPLVVYLLFVCVMQGSFC